MSPTSKIRYLYAFVSTVCLTLMVALPLGTLVFWFNFEQTLPALEIADSAQFQLDTIELWQLLCAALFSLISVSLVLIGLWNLRILFGSFKRGEFFSQQSVRSLHILSKVLLISAIIECLSPSVLSVLLTWNHGPGEKTLIVSFGSNEFWLLFIAIVFSAITWSFKEGQKLAQENAAFV